MTWHGRIYFGHTGLQNTMVCRSFWSTRNQFFLQRAALLLTAAGKPAVMMSSNLRGTSLVCRRTRSWDCSLLFRIFFAFIRLSSPFPLSAMALEALWAYACPALRRHHSQQNVQYYASLTMRLGRVELCRKSCCASSRLRKLPTAGSPGLKGFWKQPVRRFSRLNLLCLPSFFFWRV